MYVHTHFFFWYLKNQIPHPDKGCKDFYTTANNSFYFLYVFQVTELERSLVSEKPTSVLINEETKVWREEDLCLVTIKAPDL